MILRRAPLAALMCALVAPSLLACKSDSRPTPTPSTPRIIQSVLAGSGDATATAPSRQDIRAVDLQRTAPVQKLVADSGGEVDASRVIYADLTGDNSEEAIVPISSGGTLGDIAYVVLTMNGSGAVQELFTSAPSQANEGGVTVSVTDGKLVEMRPVYAAEDPNCCPSQFRRTTFAWDGMRLAQQSSETVNNPEGFKGTPPPGSPSANNPR
jgi:hypothetical protein